MLLARRTLGVKERFAITLFMLGNGVLPRALAAYLVGAELLSDRRARESTWRVMRLFRSGTLAPGDCQSCLAAQFSETFQSFGFDILDRRIFQGPARLFLPADAEPVALQKLDDRPR